MVTATPAVFEGPLSISNSAVIAQLREVFLGHGLMATALTDALGAPLPIGKAHLRDDLPFYLRRLDPPTPINTLVKLFVLDRAVDEDRARQAFAPVELEDVVDVGLVEYGPRGVQARLRLSTYDGLLVAHDAYDTDTKTLRPDHVLDVNPTTMTLSNLTVRRPVARALEIGTGCGALALQAARHAAHVIGTDTNPRALNVAAFNAAINDIANVEWRLGSLFEPVAGERFELIFCNPPYVISPDTTLIFRDGGRRGDTLCQEIVRRTPEYLTEGGFASFLVNWAVGGEEDWTAPLRAWVEGNGCDSWLMAGGTQEPLIYAALWNRGGPDRERYAAGIDRWLRYFDEMGITQIGVGAIVMRRRGGANWVRVDQVSESVKQAAGRHVEQLFAAADRLAALPDDAAVLAARFTANPDQRLHQVLKMTDGRYASESALLKHEGGLPLQGNVDLATLQLIMKCDGSRTVEEAARAAAADCGVAVDKFLPAAVVLVRRLVGSGFLV